MKLFDIAPVEGLTKVFGIAELSINYRLSETVVNRDKVLSSAHAADLIRPFYGMDIELRESFFIMVLNNANHVIGVSKLSVGSGNACVVDTRLVLLYAVQMLGYGVIMVHNHPSGTLKPSNADKELTAKMKQALQLVDIKLLDHLILTQESYFSFGDEGLI